MPYCRIKPARSVRGEIALPGDKSIAHRSIIISAIAKGKTYIYNLPTSQDCHRTIRAFKKLGVRISEIKISKVNPVREFRPLSVAFSNGVNKTHSHIDLCIEGKGLYGLSKSADTIFVGESGTTARLILGVLAGQRFWTTLTASESLSRRPMRRVTEPLRRMGAVIKAQEARSRKQEAGSMKHEAGSRKQGPGEEYLPITIKAGGLRSISYRMPVASAQVKSALLFAGLYAKGTTKIFEPIKTRDHTERMLRDFGAAIKVKDRVISICGKRELVSPGEIYIPGDISSASFFIVAAILLSGSHLAIKSVSLNPSRLGLIRVLKRMGADIKIIPTRCSGGRPIGDIIIKSSRLTGTRIKETEIPQLIDELPILMLAACFAKGKTVIYGVQELRVKETDRLISMQTNLSKMGAEIYVTGYRSGSGRLKEKIVIPRAGRLKGSKVNSFSDHRTAMSMITAGLVSTGSTLIDDAGCIAKSFPDFLKVLRSVIQ